MQFEAKRVWITGASSGIGAALAQEMAAQGALVVLSARREDRLREVLSRCAFPDRHLIFPFDATAFETHEEAVRRVEELAGPIDVLVLNAGIGQRGEALETELEVERSIMDVNYTGTVSLAKWAGRRMRSRQSGSIVVISSVLGKLSIGGSSSYSASKHALHGYFDSLRAELYGDGVRVTMVCPGYINTDITLHALQSDGSAFGVIDHNHTFGMDADVCARKICLAVADGRDEISVGGREIWGITLARLFPGLARRIARRYERK